MKHNKPAPLDEQFWRYVSPEPNSGCWLWDGSVDHAGYGKLGRQRRIYSAHRVSVTLTGRELLPGDVVCHRCDVPACVNPDHLFVGTYKDNSQDMVRKGRGQRGERHVNSRMTEDLVIRIRALARRGTHIPAIARALSVDPKTIRAIVARHTWKHVPEVEALT